MICACIGAALVEIDANGNQKEKPTLEQAYRKWHAGLAAKDKKDREKALRSMLPDEKDIRFLFPKHADKLLPLWIKGEAHLINHVDDIAKEVTRRGEPTKVTGEDVRKDKGLLKGYKRILEIIPMDVPVFEMRRTFADGGGSGGGSYLYVRDRWIWIKDLETFPDFLEKLK